MSEHDKPTQSRRDFLTTTGAAAGATALGVGAAPRDAKAATPKRGGVIRYATRSDGRGLDPHRNIVYYVSNPMSATTMGLMDLDGQMNPVAGIAEEWSISKDLKTYTFKIRKGMEFHNGRTIDAAAVKWNYERILDPKIGASFTRSALAELESVTASGDTLVCNLKEPSGVFLSNVTYYPANVMAPDSADQADNHPIGCGPFKFKSWKRYDTTVLERFENFYETGEDGKPLPYLDGMVGLPKKEDRVRLTALRAGEAHLIENMGYADAGSFPKKYGDKFNTHPVAQVGTGWLAFNHKNGPFAYGTAGSEHMRKAAAHAVDHQALHEAVFYGLSDYAVGFYGKESPWHMPEVKRWPEYDPDKAKFHLKKAGYKGEKIILTSRDNYKYMSQTGELVHAMWTDVGMKVTHEILPWSVLRAKYKKGEYHADSSANSYRPDPDAWFSRMILSSAPSTKLRHGYKNEKVDALIKEARAVLDRNKRKEMYTEIEGHINTDTPLLYTHYIPLLGASVKTLKGYSPAFPGPFSYAGGGMRRAWFDV